MKELRAKAHELRVIAQIGKNGITENMLKDIKWHLHQKKVVKIKFLSSFIEGKDKKEITENIAQKTNSKILYVVGNVAVLYKQQAIKNN